MLIFWTNFFRRRINNVYKKKWGGKKLIKVFTCLKFLEKGEILENYNLLWLFSDKRTVKKAPKKVF